MKENLKNRIVIIFGLLIVLLTGCNGDKHAEHADTYTCPMHPTVISDKPGVCPVCGMDLVRKAREGEEVEITEDLAKLIKSTNEVVASKINTIKPTYKSLDSNIDALGIVTYDTRNIYTIPARVGGRLEKVFLKYPFQRVNPGQKVAEVYSPELVTAQREFLFLIENDPDNKELITGSRNKLLLLGLSSAQIEDLLTRKEPFVLVSIYSPYEGYVINEDQEAPAAPVSSSPNSGMNGGMSGTGSVGRSTSTAGEAQLIRAGSYVSAGQTIFKIVNTSSLFVELSLQVSDAGSVKSNGQIVLDVGDGTLQKRNIDLVQPYFERGEEFVKVRVYLKSIENIHIGQLVKAKIPVHSPEALWVPKEAVVDLGLDQVVFVKDREVFRARKVTTGMRADGWIEIESGLASADELAARAQYLVDSESFIKSR